MRKLFRLEIYKTRRRGVWAIVAFLMAVQFLWMFWSMNSYARHGRELLWTYSLYQFPVVNCLMMPVALAVLASRLSDVEHKGQTLRLLETLADPGELYWAKFLCGGLYLGSMALGQTACILAVGKIVGFSGDTPVAHLALFAFSTLLCGLCLLALQQALSLLIPNQMIALTCGLAVGFVGLFALYFQSSITRLSIGSYFALLSTVAVDWEIEDRSLTMWFTDYPWAMAAVTALVATALLLTGRALFVRKEW